MRGWRRIGAPASTLDAPGVTDAAIANPRGVEGESLRLFWRIAARFAGDMAVTFVAEGGVTLAGGVLAAHRRFPR